MTPAALCFVAVLQLGHEGAISDIAVLGMDGRWNVPDWSQVESAATMSADKATTCWANELLNQRNSLPLTDHVDGTCSDDADAMGRVANADPVLFACGATFKP
jgi:hypothetical protein